VKIAFISNGYESLGIEYLSYVLKKNGYDVSLFIDPCLFKEDGFWNINTLSNIFDYKKVLLKKLKEYAPDVVCFSVFSDNYKWAKSLSKLIKDEIDGVKIIFGGIHPTLMPESVIRSEYVDCVVMGEAEETISNAIENIFSNKNNIMHGILIKKDGKIKGTIFPRITKDIDSYYPDKTIFYSKYPFYSSSYLIAASRGCPFECSYCCNDYYHKYYSNDKYVRTRRIENIIYEIELAKNIYNFRYVHFTDDVINFNRQWLAELLKKYKEKINLPYSCYVYPDLVDEDTVRAMKESGCVKVQLGVQTYSEEKRKIILKRYSSNKKIADALKLFKKYKIFVVADHIVGDFNNSKEDLYQLINFYIENTIPDLNEVFFLRYYPQSSLLKYAAKNNLISDDEVKAINDGEMSGGLINTKSRSLIKQSQSIIMISLLSKQIIKYLYKKNLFLRIPVINNILFRIITRLLKPLPYDFYTSQFIKRYIFFIKKIFRFYIKIN
jgi:radical SAM superfamily enzyme YgiQ (UPF0313 family)